MIEKISKNVLLKDRTNFLKRYFKNQIKGSFMIEMFARLHNPTFIESAYQTYNMVDLSGIKNTYETLPIPDIDFCKCIIGIDRFYSLGKGQSDIQNNHANEAFKREIEDLTLVYIKLRNYGIEKIRPYRISDGVEYSYFPNIYFSIVMLFKSLEICKEKDVADARFYSILQTLKGVFVLLESNQLQECIAMCRKLLEVFGKYNILSLCPEVGDEYDKSQDIIARKNSSIYYQEVMAKLDKIVSNNPSKDSFLHYFYLDAIKDYHYNVKENKHYSIYGIFEYLKNIGTIDATNYIMFREYYDFCSDYVHHNFALTNYEIDLLKVIVRLFGSISLSIYEGLCTKFNVSSIVNDVDVINLFKKTRREFEASLNKNIWNETKKQEYDEEVKTLVTEDVRFI